MTNEKINNILDIASLSDGKAIIDALRQRDLIYIDVNKSLLEQGFNQFSINDGYVCLSAEGVPHVEIYDLRCLNQIIALLISSPSALYSNPRDHQTLKSLKVETFSAPANLYKYALALVEASRTNLAEAKSMSEERRAKTIKENANFFETMDEFLVKADGKDIEASSYGVSSLGENLKDLSADKINTIVRLYHKYFKSIIVDKLSSGAELFFLSGKQMVEELKIFSREIENYVSTRSGYGDMFSFFGQNAPKSRKRIAMR